jgi:hypothetical protein
VSEDFPIAVPIRGRASFFSVKPSLRIDLGDADKDSRFE